MESIGIFLIDQLAAFLMGSDTFVRIENVVHRWEEKAIAAIEAGEDKPDKKAGVLDEIEIIGIKLAAWLVNTAIELAVAKINLAK